MEIQNKVNPLQYKVGKLDLEVITSFRILWNNMHHRAKQYGSEVCKEWYNFENFLNDIVEVPGCQEWLDYKFGKSKTPYELDKDFLWYLKTGRSHGQLYSPEYCCFIPRDLNLKISKLAKHRPVVGVMRDEEGNVKDVVQFGSILEAGEQGFNTSTIYKCLDTDKTHYGYTWHSMQYCKLPQQLELGDLTKEEYHEWRSGIDGEEVS